MTAMRVRWARLHRRAVDLKRAETAKQRRGFERVRRAEQQYARGLRGIARHIGELVRGFAPDDPAELADLEATLTGYADFIEPWARIHAQRMLADVSRRDEAVWAELSRTMSRALRDEIQDAPTGELLRALMAEQVALIKSLPLEAAQRVHRLALGTLESAQRPAEIAAEIMRSGEVALNRANMIARTEVARASSSLVQARAVHVGSEGYIWTTSGDADVRELHRKLNGTFVRWDDPPIAGSNGERAHAGQIYNCRCWPRVVLSEEA